MSQISKIDNSLIFEPPDDCTFDPASKLPWIAKPEQLLGHQLLIEVYTADERKLKVAQNVIQFDKEGMLIYLDKFLK
jgi:hypothetical protein